MVDIHSHILPGLDDGSRSMEQSLEMLRIAYAEGIDTMIATPHNMPGKGCPSRETVERKLDRLAEEAAKEGIPVELLMGTEYFFRQEVLEILEQGQGILLGNTDCVLVEFNPGEEKRYIVNGIAQIMELDYVPVIAHVERYMSLMEKDFETIREMRARGALIQVNCGSVIGDFGSKAKKHTRELLKKGLVDLIGTDAHSDGHRAPRMRACAKYIEKRCTPRYADRLLQAEALEL